MTHLSEIYLRRPGVLCEGYGRLLSFSYDNWRVDPRPSVLVLGRWLHPNTHNKLACGINLNYLSNDQIDKVRLVLPKILKTRNLKQRYWTARSLIPDIMGAYRTYNADFIRAVSPSTLKFMTSKEQAAKVPKAGPPVKHEVETPIKTPAPPEDVKAPPEIRFTPKVPAPKPMSPPKLVPSIPQKKHEVETPIEIPPISPKPVPKPIPQKKHEVEKPEEEEEPE